MCPQALRLHPCRSYHAHASPTSLGPDEVDEYASVVVSPVSQFVGEVGEVVADASLQVLADVMVDRGQGAAAALVDIREAQLPDLGQ